MDWKILLKVSDRVMIFVELRPFFGLFDYPNGEAVRARAGPS
jgi:hypothetical protein